MRWMICCLALAATACTDADIVAAKLLEDKIALSGDFCTGVPSQVQGEARILFLVHSSGALRVSDPQNQVVTAIEKLTRAHAGSKAVKFAVIRWGLQDVVKENLLNPPTSGAKNYTNDPAELDKIFVNMRRTGCNPATTNPPCPNYLDGTNYELAIQTAIDYVNSDITQNPLGAGGTKYIVGFITDLMPEPTSGTPPATRNSILTKVDALHGDYGVRLDVIVFGSPVIVADYKTLLPNMADKGGGTFTALSTPDTLEQVLASNLGQEQVLFERELANYFAFNRSVHYAKYQDKVGLYVDSDGDGLIDLEELELGTDPGHADTDEDGLGDFLEASSNGVFDPLSPDLHDGDAFADADGDGLTDFAEGILNTNPQAADSDRDGIPDDIELIMRLNPRATDAQADVDSDLLPASLEVAQHLDPFNSETQPTRKLLAYQTSVPGDPKRDDDNGVRCYGFDVKNITLMKTLASTDRFKNQYPVGTNLIDLVVIDRPILPPGASSLQNKVSYGGRRARRHVIFRSPHDRDPPAATLVLRPEEFSK